MDEIADNGRYNRALPIGAIAIDVVLKVAELIISGNKPENRPKKNFHAVK